MNNTTFWEDIHQLWAESFSTYTKLNKKAERKPLDADELLTVMEAMKTMRSLTKLNEKSTR